MPKNKILGLHYEIHGKGDPVLLISGLNADSASWIGVLGKFAKHFCVITFDNRGSGRSDAPDKKYSIRTMAEDAIRLLDHLGIEKCHILGHSMGGYIAQQIATDYPHRVGKLVLEATAPVSSARNNMLFNDLLKRFKKEHDAKALMRSWAYWLFSPKTFGRKNYIETFIKTASEYPYLQSAEGFEKQIGAIQTFNAGLKIRNIRAKTLVIIGSDDILIYPAESMELVKAIRGSAFEKIKDVGHCAHVEKPDIFTHKVVQFLKSRAEGGYICKQQH